MVSFRSACPTIGYLTPTLSDSVSATLWLGVVDAAIAYPAHTIAFVGGRLGDSGLLQGAENTLYRLIRPSHLDGLVSRALAVGGALEFEEVVRFHRRFHGIPMVSLALPLPGVPTIEISSYCGMRKLMSHLVDDHGYRRVAFIRGPAHHVWADERYAAYMDSLQAHCIGVDPILVTPPDAFGERSGVAGVSALIDGRKLRPGKDIEAIVAASDRVAIGTLWELERRGFCVPHDVALVGFDDADGQRSSIVSLTTVAMPFHEEGGRAVEVLKALLEDRPIVDSSSLTPRVVIRHSCGCSLPAVAEAAVGIPTPALDDVHRPLGATRPDGTALLDATRTAISAIAPYADGYAEALATALCQDLTTPDSNAFLATLGRAIHDTAKMGEDVAGWQGVISWLRRTTFPSLATAPQGLLRAQALFDQARVAICEGAVRAQAHKGWEAQRRMAGLRETSRALTLAADLPELMETLADHLPGFGIERCYLCLYEESGSPTLEGARLHLALDARGRRVLAPQGEPLPDERLLPEGALCGDVPQQLIAEPLASRGKPLGFVLFGLGPRDGRLYDLLAEEISSAVESTLLLIRNVDLCERSLKAQRVAEEASRMNSCFLSTVSHELRLPLSLLVGLSEMLLQDQAQGELNLPEVYEQDLARMHVIARQLDALVGDVLDLTQSHLGQLKLVKAPLPLQDVVDAASLVGEQMAQEKGLIWRTRLPGQLPWVSGDRMRLQQVLLNLISNAVKFTPSGEVVLEVQERDDLVTIMVRDTGLGVPLDEQDAIFDEFRQSQRTAARGYGGQGLGLALCRTLIKMHGGEIGVRSSGLEEAGSTFYFTLPKAAPIATTTNVTSAPQGDTALILTPEQDGAPALAEALSRKGIPVKTVAIDEANRWLLEVVAAPPGVVILDVQPSSQRGWDLMQALKQNPRTARIPVLFCTMLADRGGAGLISIDRLTKPLSGDALLTALRRHGIGNTKAKPQSTVLVVDDDPAVLETQVRMIHTHLPGCRVITAANGRQALAQMQCVTPDLIMLDLRMPEMDGFEVLDAMWEQPTIRRIPVIVLTGQVLSARDLSRLDQGVRAILSKGVFQTEEVVEHIQSALVSSQQLSHETQQLVRRAMIYVHEHYSQPISRKDVADYVNLSESYLSTCFRQELGVGLISYLNRYRVWQSKRLLVTTSRSVCDIALDVGFSSASYFARIFRREVGVAPTTYRREAHRRAG